MSTPDELPTPTGWRILVRVSDLADKTPGGIIMPDVAKSNERNMSSIGQVVRLGDLAFNRPDLGIDSPWAMTGDWVIFGRYAGHRIEVDKTEYRLMNDDEILAVIPEHMRDRVKRV